MDGSKPNGSLPAWMNLLDSRETAEVQWATLYRRDYHHGTAGHNQLMLIGHLAHILNTLERAGIDIPALLIEKAKTHEP